MNIQSDTSYTLHQLKDMLHQLNDEYYAQPLHILSGASIGKHVRHISEFYECMFKGMQSQYINYNLRPRNTLIETNREYAIARVESILESIMQCDTDMELQLRVNYSTSSTDETTISTFLYREIAYNLEHTIHHMAILKMAIQSSYSHVVLEKNFGVAQSTIRHQQSQLH